MNTNINNIGRIEERLLLAFDASKDGIWDWDINSNIIFFSEFWKNKIGYSNDEISNNPDEWFDRVHDLDIKNLKDSINDFMDSNEQSFEHEYRILHKDYTYRWMLCRGTALRDKDRNVKRFIGTVIDISADKNSREQLDQALGDLKFALASEKVLLEELNTKNRELKELSITDGLTKLYNHRFIQERFDFEFDRARRYNSPLSCMLIDIDHFKQINDSYGHQFGDTVLVKVSAIMKSISRSSDICGRYGGEEFMIITSLDIQNTLIYAKRIHKAIEENKFDCDSKEVTVTVSIGISDHNNEISSKHELIERTDNALYEAKETGRNKICIWKQKSNNDESSIDQYKVDDLKSKFNTLSNEVRTTYMESTNALVNAIDAKDHYTKEHSQNVAKYANLLAKEMNLPDKDVEIIKNAALLHDIGKIGITQDILLKPSSLTAEEFEIMKKHTIIGVNILKDVRFLENEIPIILHHHERFDGNGYPHNLKGERIPLGARILCVADSYDAMTTDRQYKSRMSIEDAIEELIKHSGTQFDSAVAEKFITVLSKL